MQPRPTLSKSAATAGARMPAATGRGSSNSAVHLASYRTRKAANRGWVQLRRAHKSLLSRFDSEIRKVNLGPGKGIFYRLKAGPLADKSAAASLCKALKRRRQYCEPGIMGG